MPLSTIAFIAALIIAVLVLSFLFLRARRSCEALRNQLSGARRDAETQHSALSERKELDIIKDEFIATVSHELRTPLTSIHGALGLLSSGAMGKLEDRAANLLRIANTNTDRLVRLINDILDLERMDSGQAPLHLRTCSLHDLIQHSVDTMRAMADSAGVRLQVLRGSEDEADTVQCDPDRMQQVLCNLLSNAIKFSPCGASIRVSTCREGDAFVLSVEDEGRGVPGERLDTIFDRFGQVEASDARQKGGTGLGLAICRSILAQHGGLIWAERNDAQGDGRCGSTFSFRLPRLQTSPAPVPCPVGAAHSANNRPHAHEVAAEEHLCNSGYTFLDADNSAQAISAL